MKRYKKINLPERSKDKELEQILAMYLSDDDSVLTELVQNTKDDINSVDICNPENRLFFRSLYLLVAIGGYVHTYWDEFRSTMPSFIQEVDEDLQAAWKLLDSNNEDTKKEKQD